MSEIRMVAFSIIGQSPLGGGEYPHQDGMTR
jgi:hypothetical protein